MIMRDDGGKKGKQHAVVTNKQWLKARTALL
jgi:hypothetical protein